MNKETAIKHTTVNIIMILSFIIFALVSLGIELKVHTLHLLDLSIFNWWLTQTGEPQMNFTSGLIDSYFTFFARYFDVITVVIITLSAAIVMLKKRYYSFAIWVLFAVGSGGILGIVLKDLFHRARPYDHLLADTGFSFPSGHSLASSLLFTIIVAIFVPKIKHKIYRIIVNTVSYICWMSILLSRLYFHAHFITDIMGGVAFSIFWVMLLIKLYDSLLNPWLSHKITGSKSFAVTASSLENGD
ncbi:phosphatase PAP2 family protein [Macrococcus equipercicus]|uniref:Phosphatase PAP2 family protein n=1 Tax=Macrococcus equipercicus TaxID=69967 RepID=A0ABQ6R8V5_9STAP|nr:phosphatase PAP2 family protein [Macrococcus equipercicus]KAA1039565.1 phosphatase PAP2 family protein [Macrococcus equipercicus]